MATYPVYPATTFTQAVELTIFASNQLHDVINGDALTTVETENGDIPTLRKALVDNFYFKTPINWVEGESSTVFNQLYYFDGTLATSGWYYAPQATLDNPIAMGSTPLDDDNWRLYQTATQSIPAQVYPWSTEITQVTSSIVPPYEFDTAIVTYNSLVLVPEKDYTISNNTITFTPPLTPEPDAEVPDILFCYIGKVEEGNPDTNYVTYNSLAANTTANIIGTDSGKTVQQEITSLKTSVVNLTCGTVQQLRQLEPTIPDQKVLLSRTLSTSTIINEILTYDATDTVSTDNGYSVFVTAGGKRWKADLSKGYNPLFLLGTVGYSDISACINKIAYDLAVLWGNKKGVIDYCTTIRIPGKSGGQTRYSITGAIHIPSFVTLKMDVDTYFDYYTVTNTDGIVIDNSYFPMLLNSAYDTSSTARPRSVLLWETERDIFTGGRLILTHPILSARTSNSGIAIGNNATGFIDVRGCRVRNFESLGFYYGIKINPIGNYINTFDGFHLGRNNYAVAVVGDTRINAGERFVFKDGTLGDSDSDLIYVENGSFELAFHGCSLDYSTGDMVKITKNGNALITFNQCHIEGIQGMLVNVVGSTAAVTYGKKVVFSNCMIDLGSGQNGATGWNKTWFYSSTINTYVMIEKSCRVWCSTATMTQAKTAYQSLIVTGQPANNAIVLDFPRSNEDLLDAGTIMLGKFNPTGEDKRVISTNRFSGTAGDAYNASVSTADAYGWYRVNGTWTYSPADTEDGDGLQSISVTSDSTTNTYYIMCALPYHVLSQEKFRALGAIKVSSGYTGAVNVSCGVETRSIFTMNSTTISENTLATNYSAAVDVAALAASNGRIDKFQGFCTQAVQATSFYNTVHPMSHVRVGLRITGFTGTISLKLPTVTSHRLLGS